MTRSGICREYKILEVEENHVREYNRITSKEEHINLENIKGVYVNITRICWYEIILMIYNKKRNPTDII